MVTLDGDIPYNFDAEAQCLGSIFRDESYLPRVAMLLEPKDFYDHRHRGLFNAMLVMSEAGGNLDSLRLIELGADSAVTFNLEDLVPTATACMHWAGKVKDVSYQREVYKFGLNLIESSKMTEGVLQDVEGAKERLNQGYEEILSLEDTGDDVYSQEGIKALTESIKSKRSNPGIHGIRTLFPLFDRIVKGLKTINLITATTGFGKTALALQWAFNIGVKQSISSLYINYEMEADELTERLLACGSGVWLDKIQTGDMSNEDCRHVDEIATALSSSKLNITGCQSKTIDHTLNLIHQYNRKSAIKVVFIDYIGEITAKDNEIDRGTYTTYGEWVQRIKDTCSRLGIKAVILSQVNRSGYNDMPSVENIAGSMQLAQKANVFVALCPDKQGNTVLKISKNRGGAVPEPIPMEFNRKCQRITELSDSNPF